MLTRHHCLRSFTASAPPLAADAPILDLHWHLRPNPNANLAQMDGSSISKAALLTPVGSQEAALAEIERKRRRFTWFAAAGVPPDQPYPAGEVKPGGLTDRLLAEHPNLYADLSANSGRNTLARDPNFAPGFLERRQHQLLFGSDCRCRDGHGAGQRSPLPALQDKCVARETLSVLRQASSPAVFRKLVWDNAHRLLRFPGA